MNQLNKGLPMDAYMVMAYLEELIRFDQKSRDIICENIGTYIFDYYKYSL